MSTGVDYRSHPALPAAPRRGTGHRAMIAALALAIFLQWTGASAVLPLLPLYLLEQGSSEALIGAVMAAFFVGGVLAQYLSGRLGDRIGHRPVLVGGLLAFGLASVGFLLDVGGTGYLALRTLQGAAAGAAQVASLALVARAVPAHVRGRAFSVVYGAELAGIALGPLLGSAVGIDGMGLLFVVSAGAAALASLPVLLSRAVAVQDDLPVAGTLVDGTVVAGTAARLWSGRQRVLAGLVLAAAVGGALTGVYEACWSLLLDHRGATTWEIGVSWTLFALPFVAVAPIAGWFADHYDRRRLVVFASLLSAGFAVAYPFIPSVTWLIWLGAVESIGVAVATPAAQSLLAEVVPAELSGQAQGLFVSTQTAAIAAAAAAGGGLFAIAPWVPFVLTALVAVLMTATLPVLWRHLPGRVQRAASASGAAPETMSA